MNLVQKEVDAEIAKNGPCSELVRVRLAGELSNGCCRTGESVKLSEIAAKYQLNEDAVSKIFAEFQTLGMITPSASSSAVVHSSSPEQMQAAYEIRAH